jgi:hypothetical protein
VRAFPPFARKQEQARRQTHTSEHKSRGRFEKRTVTTTNNLVESGYLKWPGARQLIRLEREVTCRGRTTRSVVYAITSLPRERANAKTLLWLLRGRWHIENKAFHVLDVAFGEDASRIRTRSAPHVLAAIRAAALNILRKLGLPVTHTLREHAQRPDRLLARLARFNNPN